MNICEVRAVTDEIVEAFGRLLPQLTDLQRSPARDALTTIAVSPSTILLIARDSREDDKIVGTLTLVLFRIPTGLRARIEDVVVDTGYRDRGVGRALVLAALQRAEEEGVPTVDLTSNPSRNAAHHLYEKLGFKLVHTNLYRFVYKDS